MKQLFLLSYKILLELIGFGLLAYFFYHAWGYDQTRNWSGQVVCHAQKVFYPHSILDIQNVIKEAINNNKKVKARGSMHSWSNIACTDGYAIDMHYLNKIQSVDIEKMQVTVEAGIVLKDLNMQLALNNLALPNLGAVTSQTLGGAIATATHGSGKTGTLSNQIIAYHIVDGLGDIHTITEKQADQFSALRVAIGALGIIYAVTIQCVPLFYLKSERKVTDWNSIKGQVFTLRDRHDYFMFQLNPYTDKVLLFCSDRIGQKKCNKHWIYTLAEYISYPIVAAAAKGISLFPSLIPKVTDISFALASRTDEGPGYELLTDWDPAVNRIEEEIAIPEKYFMQALRDTIELLQQYAQDGKYVLGGITCRFVTQDSAGYLSPAGSSNVVYISISTPSLFAESYESLLKDFERAMGKYAGKPHWGKKNFLNKEEVRYLYGENLKKFREVRKVIDPNNIFTNLAINRLIV